MKFNPNQRYTRWSIRRLSVGVASVVASGFFVLVGQPSSVRADVLTDTPFNLAHNLQQYPKRLTCLQKLVQSQ